MTSSRYRAVPERRSAIPFAVAELVLLVLGFGLLAAVLADEPGMNGRDLVLNTALRDLGTRVPVLEQVAQAISWFADGERNVWTAPIVIIVLLAFCRWATVFVLASQGGFLLPRAWSTALGWACVMLGVLEDRGRCGEPCGLDVRAAVDGVAHLVDELHELRLGPELRHRQALAALLEARLDVQHDLAGTRAHDEDA